MMMQATVMSGVIDGSGGKLLNILIAPSMCFPVINWIGTLCVFVVSASDMRVEIQIFLSPMRKLFISVLFQHVKISRCKLIGEV
jgi:hypothetical protein